MSEYDKWVADPRARISGTVSAQMLDAVHEIGAPPSIIDLPDQLQPVTFLLKIESKLSERSREVIDQCKKVSDLADLKLGASIAQQTERLLLDHEPLGLAISFLWLADLYRKNEALDASLSYCAKAAEHVPGGPLPEYKMTKAVARYMLGLSHQMLGETSAAFKSYLEAVDLFNEAQSYLKHHGYQQWASSCADVLEWLRKLVQYIKTIQLYPPEKTRKALICPWQFETANKPSYALAELVLIRPLCACDVEAQTLSFLSNRGRPWRRVGGDLVYGYEVEAAMRLLGADNTIKTYHCHVLNPDAGTGDKPILPTGTSYRLPIAGSQLAPLKDIEQGDYLLTSNSPSRVPNSLVLVQHKINGEMAMGEFERDSAGRVTFKVLRPDRFGQEPAEKFDTIGNIDFSLRSA